MRILADTGMWFRFVRRLPLSRKVEAALEDGGNGRFLCPISSMKVVRSQNLAGFPQRYFRAVEL